MTTQGAPADPTMIAPVLWHGWDGDLAFDVGGNIGQSIPVILERFTRVVTLEPAAESWEVLRGLHDDRVTCLNVAASDHDGDVLLWEQAANLKQGQLISPEHHGFFGLPGPKTPRLVPCQTLDSLAAEYGMPDLVKIDTEGHELKILHGAVDVLAKGTTGWLIEFHSRDLAGGCALLLAVAGYRPQVVRHPNYPAGSSDSLDHGWIRAKAELR